MTKPASILRTLTIGAVLTGTLVLAGCGGSPERETTTTTVERTSAAPAPPPSVSTTTTTTEQVRQSH
jgi:hypothetical protein